MKIQSYALKLLNAFAKSRGCCVFIYKDKFCIYKDVMCKGFQVAVSTNDGIDLIKNIVAGSSSDLAAKSCLRQIQLDACEQEFNCWFPELQAHFQHIPKFDSFKELELQLVLAGFWDNGLNEVEAVEVSRNRWRLS